MTDTEVNIDTKRGYKKTKMGWIPNSWNYDIIGDKIDLLTGYPFPSKDYSSQGVKLLRGANIKRGHIDWENGNTVYWSNHTEKLERYLLQEDDLVIAMDGSLVGRSYGQIKSSDLPAYVLQRVARIRTKEIDINFLKHIVSSRIFVNYCDSVKTVTAIPHISTKDIKRFKIPIPPVSEQNKIADLLSTWDEAISKTEKLINAKKRYKKGLMQMLLSGKVRFLEFEEDWKEVRFEDVVKIDAKSLNSKTSPNYRFQYISLSDIKNGLICRELETHDFNNAPSRAKRIVTEGDVLMATVRPNLQAFAMAEKEHEGMIASTGFAVLSPKKNFNNRYLYHYLYSDHISSQLHALTVGSNYPAINSSDVKKLKIYISTNQEEIDKIESVFTTIDKEIKTLGKIKDLFVVQKKGLMQKLLTGKVRVNKMEGV